MIEEIKKKFEDPRLEIVNFSVKNIIATSLLSDDWTDEEDWGGGEV